MSQTVGWTIVIALAVDAGLLVWLNLRSRR